MFIQDYEEMKAAGFVNKAKFDNNWGYNSPLYSRTVDLSTLPATVNWTAEGGVTDVKNQVGLIHFVYNYYI